VTYDSKYYEFALTAHTAPGKAEPPSDDRWVFVEMALFDRTPGQVVVLWARQKKS
jgi:hypothetical protein